MPDPQPVVPQQNGAPKLETATDVQRQWSDVANGSGPGEFIPPDKFAQLDKSVRNRLTTAARADREIGAMRGELGEMKAAFTTFMAMQNRAPNHNGPERPSSNGNGHQNGNGQPAPQGLAAQPLDALQAMKSRARQAERTLRINPEDEAAKQIVLHPDFDSYVDNIDMEISKRIAADAVKPLAEQFQSRDNAANESFGVLQRLSERFGRSQTQNPESDLFKKAADTRAQMLAERGLDANDPSQATMVALVTELAWERSSADMNRAGSGNDTRRRLETPGTPVASQSGAPQNDDRLTEISALLAQGERGKAHDLAMQEFNETRRLHPAFNASGRTAR